MKYHSFNDEVRRKMSGHEAPVPVGTWEAIAEKKKKKRRYPIFWWITGVIVLSVSIAWILYKNGNGYKEAGVAIKARDIQQTGNTAIVKAKVENRRVEMNDNTALPVPVEQADATTGKQETQQQVLPLLTGQAGEDNKITSFTSVAGDGLVISTAKSPGNYRSSDNRDAPYNSRETGSVVVSSSPRLLPFATNEDQQLQVTVSGGIKTKDSMLAETASLSSAHSQVNDLIDPGMEMLAEDKIHFSDTAIAVLPNLHFINDADSMVIARPGKSMKRNEWAIDISVMPFLPVQQSQSLLYLARTNTGSMQKAEYKTDKINTRLQPSIAYTIAFHKKINKRVRIGAGFQYAMIKEKVDLAGTETKTTYTIVQRLTNGSSGPQLTNDTVATTSSGQLTIDALNSYHLFSMPVFVQYGLMERGMWSLYLSGGIVLNISAEYRNSIEGKLMGFDNRGIYTSSQKNTMAFDLFAGFRVARRFSSFNVFAEPVLRYNVSGYNPGGVISEKLIHKAGLSLGVSYRFGR